MNLGRYKVFPLEAELQELEGQSLASLWSWLMTA
jgi:hypothetical protein